MLTTTLGLILNLLMFSLIGFLPIFFLIGSENRLLNSIALAPIAGFAITSLITTYLILLDFPVHIWFIFYTLFWIIINAGFFIYFVSRNNLKSIITFRFDKNIKWLIGGISLTTIIIALPMVLGGSQFMTFRGNATDDFNYITMARYLDQEPYSWKNIASTNDLIEKDTSFPLSVSLLSSRWTTSAVLAYTAHVSNTPIYKFDYAYTLLFFIMSFGPGYLIGRKLNLSPLLSFSVALMVCSGFWAQFVLDIRAFSEINSIPLILSVGYLVLQIVDDEIVHLFRKPILLSIFGASLIFSYTEIVPLCIVSILIFLIFLFVNKKLSLRLLAPVGMILVLTFLLSSPLYSLLSSFLISQLSYAAQGFNNWYVPFFTWLYLHPIIGFWGLVPFTFIKKIVSIPAINLIFSMILTFLGSILYFITLDIILRVFLRKISNITILLVASFVLGTLTEFLYLYAKGQLWAAGKALAYGYPFFLLLVVGATFGNNFTFLPSILNKGLKFCVLLWLAFQISLGVARNIVSVTGIEYIDYVYNHYEYRRYNYDLSPLGSFLISTPKSIIWTVLPDVWMEEYINFAFNGNQRLINTLVVTDHYNSVLGYQKLDGSPQYILTDHNFLLLNTDWTQYVVAQNSDFVLIKVDHPDFSFFTISNPYGIENWNGKAGLWIGEDKIIITVISSKISQIKFTTDFNPGPSLPEKGSRNLRITSNNGSSSNMYTVVKEKKEFTFPVNRGRNLISIEAIDQPTLTQLPNGDTRILLIGISDPKINFLKPK